MPDVYPNVNRGTIRPRQGQVFASFALQPGYNCFDISAMSTALFRNQMQIPDTVIGHQFVITDAQGTIFTLGDVGSNGIIPGNEYACTGITVFADEPFENRNHFIFGGSESGSNSGSGSSSSSNSGSGSTSSSGSGSGSGSGGSGIGMHVYYAGRWIFVLPDDNDYPCSDDCPCEDSSNAPIRYADGKIMEKIRDLTSSGGGLSWTHTRSYDNTNFSSLEYRNGYRWVLDSVPTLRFANTSSSFGDAGLLNNEAILVAYTPTHVAQFDRQGNGYVAHGDCRDTLTHNTVQKVFEVRRKNGDLWLFNDYSDTTAVRGALKSITTAGGTTLTVIYNADKTPSSVRKTFVENSVTKLEEILYAYTTCTDGIKRIQYATLRRSANNGVNWSDVKRVKYDYYGSENFGTAGDLKLATTQVLSGGVWVNTDIQYYRYYKAGESNKGFEHGLKYIFESGDYARFAAATNPLTATDAVAAQYATKYFEYDANRRVVLEKTDGGTKTYTLAFYEGIVSSDLNTWQSKTVETFHDGSKKTVYTNQNGRTLLTDEASSGSYSAERIINHYVYDAGGNLIQHNTPDVITSYDEYTGYSSMLSVSLNSTKGLINKKQYYNNVSGQPNGYLYREIVKNGSGGTEIVTKQYEYVSQTANGQTSWFIAKVTEYPTENMTNPAVIQYTYTFFVNSMQMQQRTTTLPAVSTNNNGNATTATRVERFDQAGKLIWSRNELGIITYHQYDLALGVRVKTIQDVLTSKTADFNVAVPSGWATASGAGKHLVSLFEYDSEGRLTQSLAPQNTTVNASNQSISTRTASWSVYDDVNRKTMTANGYATLDANGNVTGYTLVNPVSITIRDADGNVLEQIQAARASTSGKLLATDTFARTSYTAWAKNVYNAQGKLTATRQYFLIPASGDGTKGVNYHETTFAYDAMGRQNKTVS
ncbi:MAG: hypothetical protein FWD31_05015, partial [Planctomycetaceae bacterium]|nr:hypothetical protein [Planctomycetaceae bacterium]